MFIYLLLESCYYAVFSLYVTNNGLILSNKNSNNKDLNNEKTGYVTSFGQKVLISVKFYCFIYKVDSSGSES